MEQTYISATPVGRHEHGDFHKFKPEAMPPGNSVDLELDRFIAMRHRHRVTSDGGTTVRETAQEKEDRRYREMVERQERARREQIRLARIEFHKAQASRLKRLIGSMVYEHEQQARYYERMA